MQEGKVTDKSRINKIVPVIKEFTNISIEIDKMLSDVADIVENINSGKGTLSKLINRSIINKCI